MFDLLDIPQPAVPQTAHRVPLAMEEMPAFGAQELSCQAPLPRKDMYGGATESKLLHQLQELFDDSAAFDDSSYSSNDSHVSSGSDEDSHPTVIEGRRPHGLKRPGSSQGQGRVKRVARAGASSPKRKPARLLLWRKYGQKHLKGDQKGLVRCYYRCHDPQCPAKRFIEKPASDLSQILEVRHEGAHNHPVSPEFDDLEPV